MSAPVLPVRCRTEPVILLALAGFLALPAAALAAGPGSSTIAAIKLYPGSATVERTLQVEAGARDAAFFCLPAALDRASLQVEGNDAIQVGEIAVRRQPARLLGKTCASPLTERIGVLQEQMAAVHAESLGVDYATAYLKGFAQTGTAGAPQPAQIRSTAAALEELAQDALMRQHRLQSRQAELQRELDPLLAERDRGGGEDAEVSTVRVRLVTLAGGTLRLRYQVPGPGWQPAYRATLDSSTSGMRLERIALVSQGSGEDWDDAPLTLSTGRPAAATEGPLPRPWRIAIRPEHDEVSITAAAPAPAMTRLASPAAAGADATAPFEVSVADGSFATEFSIPQRVSVPSGVEQVALTLGEETIGAELRIRSTPALDRNAYLIAGIALPQGVWPAGTVTLFRDGAFVGAGRFDPHRVAREGLAFGPDERVRVEVQRPEEKSGTQGLIATQNRRVDERRYRVTNGHDTTIRLQLLDAAPVSQHDRIVIQSEFQPQPQTTSWLDQAGTVAWEQPLEAGAVQEFRATHTVSWPRDERLREQR